MNDSPTFASRLTETLVSELTKALALPFHKARPDRQRLAFMYQLIRLIVSGQESFGDLVSAENTKDRAHLLATITKSAHHVLKIHISRSL
jgi:hypothetical protein